MQFYLTSIIYKIYLETTGRLVKYFSLLGMMNKTSVKATVRERVIQFLLKTTEQ